MNSNSYKAKVSKLIEKAEQKGVIKKYSKFCNTKKQKIAL